MKLSPKTLPLIAIGIAVALSVLSFFGIWVPNRFGVGMLWLGIAVLLVIWFINTDYKAEEDYDGVHDHGQHSD